MMSEFRSRVAVFHSRSGQDHSAIAQQELDRAVFARKRTHPVQVRFAQQPCDVETLEGPVHAQAGDAIVTGPFGEIWAVPAPSFAGKYKPVPPLRMGTPGVYLTLPIEVRAIPMETPFEVILVGGHSRLSGKRGDWLIDYGDGSLGIVDAAIFDATYEIGG